MNHKTILLFIVGLIALSAIYPIRHYYAQKKTIAALPDYTGYEKAVFDSLKNEIQAKAAANRCKDYIIPVEKVSGPDNSLPNITEDVNIALSSYTKWRLTVDKKTEARIKRRKEQRAEKFKYLGAEPFVKDIVLEKRTTELKTRYSASAEWVYDKSASPDNVKLVVRIFDDKSETELFRVARTFLHPDTEKELREQVEGNKAARAVLANRSDFSAKLFWGFNALLLVYIFGLGANSVIKKKRTKITQQFLLSEIQKRESLIQNGHFVTAYELAEKYLKYFPDDTEIAAFRERLLDFTNNDPKTAQVAFVEAQKLKLRLEQVQQSTTGLPRLINAEEKDNIVPLLPYNKDLNVYYNEVLQLEDKEQKAREFSSKLQAVKDLFEQGCLNEADRELSDLQRNYAEKLELSDLQKKIEQQKSELEKIFAEVAPLLKEGQVSAALELLEKVLSNYKDYEKAVHFRKEVEEARGMTQFRLSPESHGKAICVFCKNEIVIGREDDAEAPDLEIKDKRISRKHLRLSIVDDRFIAEDLGSAGGSFVNGHKITSKKLKNGDRLNLAKTIDMNVSTYGKDGSTALLLKTKDMNYLLLPNTVKFGFDKYDISFKSGELSFFHENQLTVLSSQNELQILKHGLDLKFNQKKYRVEEMK